MQYYKITKQPFKFVGKKPIFYAFNQKPNRFPMDFFLFFFSLLKLVAFTSLNEA